MEAYFLSESITNLAQQNFHLHEWIWNNQPYDFNDIAKLESQEDAKK